MNKLVKLTINENYSELTFSSEKRLNFFIASIKRMRRHSREFYFVNNKRRRYYGEYTCKIKFEIINI